MHILCCRNQKKGGCEMAQSKLHIAMFPWFAHGHMTPYLHLSNELAQRGHKISFLLPKKAQTQLQNANLHPELITFYAISVPQVEGLPPGAETATDIPLSLVGRLAAAMDLTRDEVNQKLHELKPDFVFYDITHWMPELSLEIGFKTVCYNVVGAASIAIALVPARKSAKDGSVSDEELMELPAGYPASSTVALRKHEARSLSFIFMECGDGITFYERITTAMRNCDAISIRTCSELEGPFSDYIGTQYGKPMLLTGPVLPEPTKAPLEHRWAEFLHKFAPGTVVFCAFGSQLILEKQQFHELILGFELTGLPFLIALKPPLGCTTIEEALPEGFEERIQGRGIIHGGMVQQPLILNHPSVGCFVSHCGFGSMWESLMSGCQIVLVPHLVDQILNTRLLAEELKVAVEVERDENGWFTKEDLCKNIKSVMDKDSKIGCLVKENHAKWKETLADPSFMKNYVETFISSLHEIMEESKR